MDPMNPKPKIENYLGFCTQREKHSRNSQKRTLEICIDKKDHVSKIKQSHVFVDEGSGRLALTSKQTKA